MYKASKIHQAQENISLEPRKLPRLAGREIQITLSIHQTELLIYQSRLT